MSAELTSIIATLVNVVLTVLKITAGILTGSAALLAEAIHSGLDILSSLITFIGIKTAQKPSDPKHPYGFYRAEVLAGTLVALLLGVSGVWIIYEGVVSYLGQDKPQYSYLAIGFMIVSIIANEVMARLKFKAGNEHESISLVADAEHSRADVISSAGVLLALILIPYISWIDSVVAVLVGIYIIYEAVQVGKEAVDSLIDISDPLIEQKIKDITKREGIKLNKVKTRRIGSAVFAEISISLDSNLNVSEASSITRKLEEILDGEISSIKQATITVESHDTGMSTIFSSFGGRIRTRRGIERIGPVKKGERTVVAIDKDEQIISGFGAEYYLLIDKDKNGKEINREKIKNPYWDDGGGHGVKFLKSVSADKFYSKKIGSGAKQNLENNGIKYETRDSI